MDVADFIAARARPAVPKSDPANSGTAEEGGDAKELKTLAAILKAVDGVAPAIVECLDKHQAAEDANEQRDRDEMAKLGEILGTLVVAVGQIVPAMAKWVEERGAEHDARMLALHAEMIALRADVRAIGKPHSEVV